MSETRNELVGTTLRWRRLACVAVGLLALLPAGCADGDDEPTAAEPATVVEPELRGATFDVRRDPG